MRIIFIQVHDIDEMTEEKREVFNEVASYYLEWIKPEAKLETVFDRFNYQVFYIASIMEYLNEENKEKVDKFLASFELDDIRKF